MSDRYILRGKTPVKCDDLLEWARWFDFAERHVAFTKIQKHTISTVFLGIDHNFSGEGPPALFETMVFDKEGDEVDCKRSATWAEAEIDHNTAAGWVTREYLARVPASKMRSFTLTGD